MWDYRAQLYRVIDGDTIIFTHDQGFSGRQEEAIRLLGVSAPELSQPGGIECRDFTIDWVNRRSVIRWPLYIVTDKNTNPEPTERRTLTRYLGTVYDYIDRTHCLNAELADFLAAHPDWGSGQ